MTTRSVRSVNPLRLALSAGAAASMFAATALAGPENGQLVHGQGSIHQNGANTTIHAGNGSIFQWQSFNIGAGEHVRFIQPGSSSKVLNRITGPDPSRIAGQLTANGNVYIVNPAGVYFAHGSIVNVGGLYAAAGSISNADFLSGSNKFTGLTGSVENRGSITGSAINLIGQRVANYGTIVAPQGMVAMAAGDEVYVGKENGQIFARVSSTSQNSGGTGVKQAGTIDARGGQVALGAGDMYAVAIHHTGTTTAKNIKLEGGQQRGIVQVAGRLDASNQGANQTGGHIEVTGDRVGITGGTLDASGARGGGTILVGGEYQGRGETPTATRTVVSANSTLNAEATQSGDGGRVIVWSDETTIYKGNLSVRGGTHGGNGGFAEVSGKLSLFFTGGAQTHSRSGGRDGTLLLDPRDITIQAGVGPDDGEVADSEILFGDGGPATDFVIGTDALEALTGNILLQAQRDLTLLSGAALNLVNQTAGETVTFQAGNDINILGAFQTAGASIILQANNDGGGTSSGTGAINIGANINTGDGDLVLTAVAINLGADLITEEGNISLNAPVILTSSVTIEGDAITFFDTLDSEATELNNLQINSNATSFRGSIGAATDGELGILTTNAAGVTAIDAPEVNAQSIAFNDRVVVQQDLEINASNVLTFGSTVNSASDEANDLTLNGPNVNVKGVMGTTENARLGTLQTDAGGTLTIDTESINAERLTIRDAVVLERDATLSATAAMTILGAINSAGGETNSLTLDAPAIALYGQVGAAEALDAFETVEDSTLFLNTTAITADTITLGGAIDLGADATLTGATSVAIGDGDSRAGQSYDLTVNSPETTFNGVLGSTQALGIVSTNAAGTTTLDNATIEAAQIRFNDAVAVAGDNALTGTSIVRFGGTLNGTTDQSSELQINSPQTVFVGNIGTTERVGTLSTDQAGTTTIGPTTVRVGNATFGDDVVFTADANLNATGRLDFKGEVNSEANEENNLTLEGAQVVLSQGAGTGTDGEFGTLLAIGATTIAGEVTTTGDQTYQGAVRIAEDTTINAPNVVFESTVNSVDADRSLTINTSGNGLTRFEGNVGVVGPLASLTTNEDGRTELAAPSLFVSGDVRFNDVVFVDSNVTVSGNNVRFDRTVDSMTEAHSLTVVSPGTTTFIGVVGGQSPLAALTTNAVGTTRIEGGSVTTTGSQSYNDNVIISGDTTLVGGGVSVGGTLNSATSAARDLTIRTGANSTTSFGGAIGNTNPLLNLIINPQITSPTTGVIRFFGESVRTTGDQLYNQRVALGEDITFTGNDISFVQGIDSTELLGAAGLTVNSTGGGITRLFGPIGDRSALRSITTNADGRTILGNAQGATEDNSSITTIGAVALNDPVTVRDDIEINGAGGIAFGNALNAAVGDANGPDVRLFTDVTTPGSPSSPAIPRITFTNSVGDVTPLGSLTVGRDLSITPAVATVGAGLNSSGAVISNYGLVINTRRGFTMGQRQKFTVLGDFTLNAGTQATLSDINTLGSLTINAPEITLLRRPAGTNVIASGSSLGTARDPGLDFVAGEAITFAAAPTVIGSGNPPRFGTPDGEGISPNLAVFSSRAIGEVTESMLRRNTNFLDAIAAGPANVNLATAIPPELPSILAGEVPEEQQVSEEAREQLAETGIGTRDPARLDAAVELSGDRRALLAFLSAPGIYMDVTGAEDRALAVSVSRLPADLVERALASYRAVFSREEVDPSGQRRDVPNAEHVSQVLSASWAEYSKQAGDKADGVGYRAYLEAVPQQAEALHYVNALRRLFTDIGYLGLGPAETRRVRANILSAINVQGMTRQQLETAIVTVQIGQ